MTFAAEFYVAKNKTGLMNMRLAAADVSGGTPVVKSFLELG
jgi:hypothetical protein